MKQRRILGAIAALSLALLMPSHAAGGEITARARIDSSSYLIGDRIGVHVELRHPPGASFQSLVGDTIGGFQVIERLSMNAETESATSTGLVLARYDTGAAVIPPLPFLCSVPGDSAYRTVRTNVLAVTVHAIPVDTTRDIKDLKPPFSIPLTLAEILLYTGIVLACAGLSFLLYRLWKKRKRKLEGEPYLPPPRPAHVIALEQLAILQEKRLWQQGLIKQFYTEVTEILRRYIENRFQIMAMEETTDEIMTGLRGLRLETTVLQEAEAMLLRADLVKFAKSRPGIPEHEETIRVVYHIVDRTKAVAMTPVTSTEAKAAAYVGS